MSEIGDHAVVLGASMGGLLAARVLADAYRRVTIVERDPLPESGLDRKGVPQGRHAHVLLPRGAQILDELFPGLLPGLAAGGVPVLHHPREIRIFLRGHLLCQHGEPGEPAYQPSRPYLEHQVRKWVRALPNVTIWDRWDVAGLVTTPARDRVTGARVRPRTGGVGEEQILAADLVVDATGRTGRTPAWLKELGYDPPAEEQIRVDIKYASRYLRPRPGALGEEKLIVIGAVPERPTTMALAAQEDDRWILTLAGYSGHHPPAWPGRVPGLRPAPGPRGGLHRDQRRRTARRDQHPPVPGQSTPGATNSCAASPPGCWWRGTLCAASIRSTGKA